MEFKERVEALMGHTPVTRPMEIRDLALKSGISTRRLKSILNGVENTKYSELEVIADIFKVSVEQLKNGAPGIDVQMDAPVTSIDDQKPGCTCGDLQSCKLCEDDDCDGDGVSGE